ncbi:MAG: hypothetical protein ACI8TP_001886 [Acidimicrobiales bacterium]|jgi:hypothetical protein
MAWCNTITRDALQHFVWGIGDDNPYWPASGTAPGCFLYAVNETTVAPGLDDHRRIYRSVEWTWFETLPVGTDISVEVEVVAQAGDDQRGRTEFRSADGTRLAAAEVRCGRTTEPATAIDARPEVRYSGTEIETIEQAILGESRQGPMPLGAADVAVGDELGTITKGPLSIMDVVAWCSATQGVAVEADCYSEGGLHAETATGPQLVSWIAQLATNWMGDAGFLQRLRVDINSNPPLGSTTTISGRVSSCGAGTAELALVATDQSNVESAVATATVLLPQ